MLLLWREGKRGGEEGRKGGPVERMRGEEGREEEEEREPVDFDLGGGG